MIKTYDQKYTTCTCTINFYVQSLPSQLKVIPSFQCTSSRFEGHKLMNKIQKIIGCQWTISHCWIFRIFSNFNYRVLHMFVMVSLFQFRRSAHVEYQRFLSGLIFKLGCYNANLLLMINGQDVSCTI